MKYSKAYDFYYNDVKDYKYKANKAYRKTKGYRENQRKTKKHRNEMSNKWYHKNKERVSVRMRERYQNNKDHIKNQKTIARYGITLEEREQMILEQDNKCLRCGLPFDLDNTGNRTKDTPVVDHDHSYGRGNPDSIRGIIHDKCNVMIGMHSDSIEELEKSIKYLKKYGKKEEF